MRNETILNALLSAGWDGGYAEARTSSENVALRLENRGRADRRWRQIHKFRAYLLRRLAEVDVLRRKVEAVEAMIPGDCLYRAYGSKVWSLGMALGLQPAVDAKFGTTPWEALGLDDWKEAYAKDEAAQQLCDDERRQEETE